MKQTEFKQVVIEQDNLVSSFGVDIWVGMEPTFTRRFAETPEWLSEALGMEKLTYAYSLLDQVCKRQPGGIVLHTLGRQYISEDLPRWSIGYYQSRHNEFTWDAAVDPCLAFAANSLLQNKSLQNDNPDRLTPDIQTTNKTATDIEAFWQVLNDTLNQIPWPSVVFQAAGDLGYRLLFRCDGNTPIANVDRNPKLARPSVHAHKIPVNGLTDELASQGEFLLCMELRTSEESANGRSCLVLELPALPDVKTFLQLMQCIAEAAKRTAISNLHIQGFPPPVDDSVAWTTITPDPAVIEINQAPANNAANFYDLCTLYYDAAQDIGLHPYRLHYNGVLSDSGGGGQFTLGGPQPLLSPFFRDPHLLPRLVRYFNAHPALSYWFAPSSIGGSSQSPRTDEGGWESFFELALALEQLESMDDPRPEFIWHSLNPFLVDPSGNPHRSELNIEKLWNPYLPGRGCLGLVEFRAFRMPRSPECATAIAILLRSIVAMLGKENKVAKLMDHGRLLHDKFALPFFLREDLQYVFGDLRDTGLPLHEAIKTLLLQEPVRGIGKAEFHGCCIELEQALEFWPLIGDVASQEGGGSRLVDASTTRLQLTLRDNSLPAQLEEWEIWVDGYRIPLHGAQDQQGPVKITGLRYRNFLPNFGLHPGIAARNTITLVLAHRSLAEAMQITYNEWHPQGIAYPGLPVDIGDAEQRRAERFITQIISVSDYEPPLSPPDAALSDYCLDLRWLPVSE